MKYQILDYLKSEKNNGLRILRRMHSLYYTAGNVQFSKILNSWNMNLLTMKYLLHVQYNLSTL